MARLPLDALRSITVVRSIQKDAAELSIATAQKALHGLLQDRLPLVEAIQGAADGYLRCVERPSIEPLIAQAWRAETAATLEALGQHDMRIDEARAEALRRAEALSLACGRLELARTTQGRTERRARHLRETRAFDAVADLDLTRRAMP